MDVFDTTYVREVIALTGGACACLRCTQDRAASDPFDSANGHAFDRRFMKMFLCVKCGNKRCPHANDHRNECTNSNSAGQKGSFYE